MDIFFQGEHTNEEAAESVLSVLRLFKERYQIENFREIHLSLTLVDMLGNEVELVDNKTNETYRCFEVYRQGHELSTHGRRPHPYLQLVIDNTQKK